MFYTYGIDARWFGGLPIYNAYGIGDLQQFLIAVVNEQIQTLKPLLP